MYDSYNMACVYRRTVQGTSLKQIYEKNESNTIIAVCSFVVDAFFLYHSAEGKSSSEDR